MSAGCIDFFAEPPEAPTTETRAEKEERDAFVESLVGLDSVVCNALLKESGVVDPSERVKALKHLERVKALKEQELEVSKTNSGLLRVEKRKASRVSELPLVNVLTALVAGGAPSRETVKDLLDVLGIVGGLMLSIAVGPPLSLPPPLRRRPPASSHACGKEAPAAREEAPPPSRAHPPPRRPWARAGCRSALGASRRCVAGCAPKASRSTQPPSTQTTSTASLSRSSRRRTWPSSASLASATGSPSFVRARRASRKACPCPGRTPPGPARGWHPHRGPAPRPRLGASRLGTLLACLLSHLQRSGF